MCKKQTWIPVCILLALVILTALFSRTNLFRLTIALNDGEAAEEQFYHRGENNAEGARMVAAGIVEGYYYLSPYLAQDTALITQDNKMTLVSVTPVAADDKHMTQSVKDKEQGSSVSYRSKAEQEDAVTKVSKIKDIENKILLWKESGGVCMRFRSNERVLAADRSGDEATLTTYLDDGMNSFYEPREEMAYHWKIQSADGGGYYITIDDLALTYRNGEMSLEALVESEGQRWMLQW